MLSSLNGCVGASTQPFLWQDETVDLVWPPPPDEPRISYLRSLLGPQDFKAKDRTSGVLEWFLGERQNDLPLLSPFAVATSRSGLIWVADNGARMLYRLDLNRRKVDYFKEFAGIRLFSPSGVAVDEASRRVFLADAESPRVFVLDFEGNYLESWGPTGGFKRPAGLALDSTGRLYVADVMGKSVYVFNIDGSLAKKVQSRLSTDGRFKKPLNVAIGPNDEVLVLDAISFTVEVQDAQGELMATIGQPGNAAGYFARPKGLAVDREGHVFVSDSAFDNIQVFDLAGNLLMFFGETGGQFGQFNLVSGLFVDEEDRLFVADSYNHRIQAFKLLH
jgi:DNA-binding beta-propeller fold protein YncE